MRQVPFMLMRGGTSRGPYFLANDLPKSREQRGKVLLHAMGSPDPFGSQANGLGGGGVSILSKAAIVCKAEDDPGSAGASSKNVDVCYTFAQVGTREPAVKWKANCGNIMSGVGPFAILRGLVDLTQNDLAVGYKSVRVLNTNTSTRGVVKVPLNRGCPSLSCNGDLHPRLSNEVLLQAFRYADEDVAAKAGIPVEVSFLDVLGPLTGKIFPTGKRIDVIQGVRCTCIDSANPVVLMHGADLSQSLLANPVGHDETIQGKSEVYASHSSCNMIISNRKKRQPIVFPDLDDAHSEETQRFVADLAARHFGENVVSTNLIHEHIRRMFESFATLGYQNPESLNSDTYFLSKLEQVRREASRVMGMGDARGKNLPKVCVLSPPLNPLHSIASRYFVPDRCHSAHAVTGAIAIAVATTFEGTVADSINVFQTGERRNVVVEHPSGTVTIEMTLDVSGSPVGKTTCEKVNGRVLEAKIRRTTRPIVDGKLFVPEQFYAE